MVHFSFTNSVSEWKSKSWLFTKPLFGETVFAEGDIYSIIVTIKIHFSCHLHLSWILLKYFLQLHLLLTLPRRFIVLHKKIRQVHLYYLEMCPPKHEEWLVYNGTCCCCPWANSSFRFLSAVNSVDKSRASRLTSPGTRLKWWRTSHVNPSRTWTQSTAHSWSW